MVESNSLLLKPSRKISPICLYILVSVIIHQYKIMRSDQSLRHRRIVISISLTERMFIVSYSKMTESAMISCLPLA